jgi:general secretion pathway protein G
MAATRGFVEFSESFAGRVVPLSRVVHLRVLAMKNQCRNSGFTLIEVLIVVVIMAVLAATIIPQFTASTDDAQESAALHNLHAFRTQIQLYRAEHEGAYPTIADDADSEPSLPQLYSNTNSGGAIGTAGPSFPLGPYMVSIPNNPYDNKNDIIAYTGTWPPTAATGDGGWLYKATTGQICLNHDAHLDK